MSGGDSFQVKTRERVDMWGDGLGEELAGVCLGATHGFLHSIPLLSIIRQRN